MGNGRVDEAGGKVSGNSCGEVRVDMSVDVSRDADPRWEALLKRDRAWDGAFVFGVTSTGIYCRPSCPAKRARRDRIRFFASPAEARDNGFRSCKRCHPDSAGAGAGAESLVARVLPLLEAGAGSSGGGSGSGSTAAPSLGELALAVGVSKSHLQRKFTEVMGVSPRQYAEYVKSGRLAAALRSGATAGRAAMDAGFNSLSRAQAVSESHMGMSPGAVKRGGRGVRVRYVVEPCSLGMVLVALTEKGVCRIILGDSADEVEKLFLSEYPDAERGEVEGAMRDVVRSAVAVAAGDTRVHASEIPLDLHGTAFQLRVWRALQRVPRGETVTYKELAAAAGNERAVRAAGSACGANPVALLVPCHRALRSDGALGGYRWGLERKAQLLAKEARQE